MHIGPADQCGPGPEGQGLQHIGAAADAAIDQHGQVLPDSIDDAWQHLCRGGNGVERAAAVVGDDEGIDVQAQSLSGVGRVQHALEDHGQMCLGLQPGDVIPGGGVVEHVVKEGAATRLQEASGRRLQAGQIDGLDAFGHLEMRAAFTIACTAGRCVHGDDQGFVAGGLGAAHELQGEAAIMLDVKLQPQWAAVWITMDGVRNVLQRHACLRAQYQTRLLCGRGIGCGQFAVGVHHLLVGHRGQQHGPGQGAPQQLAAGVASGQRPQHAWVELQVSPCALVGAQRVFIRCAAVQVGPGGFGQALPCVALVVTQRNHISGDGRGGIHVSAHMRSRL